MNKRHVVSLAVRNGEFDYGGKECVMVEPGDTVIWKSDARGHLAIQFGFETPFESRGFKSKEGKPITATVVSRSPGVYKYTAVIYDGEELWLDDPVIIIRPPKTG